MGCDVSESNFFSPWEGEPVTSWADATRAIEEVLDKAGSAREMAWRGQADASWGLHSSLYRKLPGTRGVASKAPNESDLLRFEDKVASYVRKRWRYDQMPYLELLAQLQHFNAPTRLLDVTLSPLVALWFAVERRDDENETKDARLFAFDVSHRVIHLTDKWKSYDIPWRNDGVATDWCREPPLFWRPPAYNDRIPAQQAGFLLGGVPKFYAGQNAKYRKAPRTSGEFWKIDEVRRATSVPARMVDRDRAPNRGSEPTFTLRIKAEAKGEIRRKLELSYGINPSTMYPDLFGMAEGARWAIDHEALDG